MKKLYTLAAALLLSAGLSAQEAQWMQFPSISPDGSTIAFGYMGNIYTVSSQGGVAIPLTVGEDYNQRPVWSHDGKTIAFASDRYGNFDVFTMPAAEGAATRLTFHSAADYPYDFTPDNKKVLFGSFREAPASSVRFPGLRYFQNLYTIPAEGGRPILLTAAGAEEARFNPAGTQVVFQDKKGYEDEYRKHHTSSITRDIWIYDLPSDSYQKITSFKGEDRTPNFNSDGSLIYYTSEQSGDLNIYRKTPNDATATALTNFKDFPVRGLTMAQNGTMAFTWKGDLYTLREGESPKKLQIEVRNNSGYNTVKEVPAGRISEFAVSPDGKEIAYISRGELFVSSADNKQSKRITNTPYQERMITWSPDGKSLTYSVEKDGSWNVYKVTLEHAEEKFFFASTTLKTEKILDTEAEEFKPQYSPDGKKLAFIENRNVLKVLDLKSGNKVTILPEGQNHSYSDGDWGFEWSPDSKWLLVDDQKGYFSGNNVALFAADGSGKKVYPVNSGFGESNAKWALEGKAMAYKSSKLGRKSLAYQGSKETDIYAVFFDQKAYDEFKLSEDDYKIQKEQKEKEKPAEEDKTKAADGKKSKKGKTADTKKEEAVKPLQLDLNNLEERIVRLTINSASIGDFALTKDGSKLYYLAAFEKGFDLWETEPRTRKTKILAKLGGSPSSLYLSKDEKTLILSNKGSLTKVDVATGKLTPISTAAKINLDTAAEREYIFDHAWRQVVHKFYDPKIHGIDWEMYREAYAKFLPHINNNYDFQILLSELLGELNASHTGGRYSHSSANADQTASLGLLYDETYQGKGIKIDAVIPGGPLDKADSKIKKGDQILKINGEEIAADKNWNQMLTNLSGTNTRLTVSSGGKTFEQIVKPTSFGSEQALMYKRWIKKMEQMTDSLSNGKIGYVHIQGMNDGSFREVYENALGRNLDKEAIVIDTRFNGGGWLHDDLNTFFSGYNYLKFAPQGDVTKGGESASRWNKPSIVVMSEGNYSDAFIFPYVYKQNGVGKLVGMPVPGTGTAVWWETQIDPSIVFGIPMVATIGKEGRPTENLELEPNIEVTLPYKDFLNGKDPQLATAVSELLKEVK